MVESQLIKTKDYILPRLFGLYGKVFARGFAWFLVPSFIALTNFLVRE